MKSDWQASNIKTMQEGGQRERTRKRRERMRKARDNSWKMKDSGKDRKLKSVGAIEWEVYTLKKIS